ncbi:MAG TPA: hypothetical protein EYP31_05730, partial [Roseibacterium sp.]|nr:hypothetical protein [Roseibacterium sp.]
MTQSNPLILMVDQLNRTVSPDGPADWLPTPPPWSISASKPPPAGTMNPSAQRCANPKPAVGLCMRRCAMAPNYP